jgi:hypothetical protein
VIQLFLYATAAVGVATQEEVSSPTALLQSGAAEMLVCLNQPMSQGHEHEEDATEASAVIWSKARLVLKGQGKRKDKNKVRRY